MPTIMEERWTQVCWGCRCGKCGAPNLLSKELSDELLQTEKPELPDALRCWKCGHLITFKRGD